MYLPAQLSPVAFAATNPTHRHSSRKLGRPMLQPNRKCFTALASLFAFVALIGFAGCGGGGSSTQKQDSVPNVVGQTQAAATSAITGAGLVVGTVTKQASSTVASGTVISENPAAGSMVSSGSAVNLVVSSGPAQVAVPNVVGQTQAAATTAITTAGLALGTVTTQESTTVPSGTVISESPAAGTQVSAGSAVNLILSSGPPPLSASNVNLIFVTSPDLDLCRFGGREWGYCEPEQSGAESVAHDGKLPAAAGAGRSGCDRHLHTGADDPPAAGEPPRYGSDGNNPAIRVAEPDHPLEQLKRWSASG